MKKILLVFAILIIGELCFADEMDNAVASFLKGDYATAEYQFLSILEKEPNNQKARMYYGDVQAHLGNRELAKWEYKKAYSYNPDSEDALRIQNRMARIDSEKVRKELSKIHISDADLLKSMYGDNKPTKWGEMPIKVYIPQDERKELTRKAFIEWEKKTAKAVSFKYVESPKNANVVVNFIDNSDLAEDVRYSHTEKVENNNKIVSAKVFIVTHSNGQKLVMPNEVYVYTLTHELGHMLGLENHVGGNHDLMKKVNSNVVKELSPKDVRFIKVLYQSPQVEKPDSKNDKKELSKVVKSVEDLPSGADGWQKFGDFYFKKENYYAAIDCYLKAVKFATRKPEVYLNLTKSYNALKKYNDAILYGRRGLTINPNDSKLLKEVMTAYKSSKIEAGGKVFLQNYLKRYPSHRNNRDIQEFIKMYKI